MSSSVDTQLVISNLIFKTCVRRLGYGTVFEFNKTSASNSPPKFFGILRANGKLKKLDRNIFC